MSSNPTGQFDLNQGLESVSMSEDASLAAPFQQVELPPTGQALHTGLDSVIVKSPGIDEMLLRELNPEIKDKMSMAPARYHRLLAKGAAALFKAGSEHNDADLMSAAQLIFEELELLRTMAAQRGLNGSR